MTIDPLLRLTLRQTCAATHNGHIDHTAAPDQADEFKYTGRSCATRARNVRIEYIQPSRSAITVAGIVGHARSNSRTAAPLHRQPTRQPPLIRRRTARAQRRPDGFFDTPSPGRSP